MRNLIQTPLIVLAVSFLVMWISARIGAYGHKWFNLDEDTLKDLDLIVPATLTLLGLIIGFSFSMAISRYDQRKTYEEARGQRNRHGILPGRPAAVHRRREGACTAEKLSRSACLVLRNP